MSDYFSSFGKTTKRRYREKLESVGVVDVTEEDTFLWRNESDEYAWQRDSVDDIMHTSDTSSWYSITGYYSTGTHAVSQI